MPRKSQFDKPPVKISFDEDADLIARIDAVAAQEGTNRATIIRRTLRRVFLPTPPTSGTCPETRAA